MPDEPNTETDEQTGSASESTEQTSDVPHGDAPASEEPSAAE